MEEKFHENLMDEAYNLWNKNLSISYENFLELIENQLSPLHTIGVIFGNLNYQVDNGGFIQWYDNNYSCSIEKIINFLEDNKTFDVVFEDVLHIVYGVNEHIEHIEDGKKEINKVSYDYQDFFKESLGHFLQKNLNRYDTKYYKINNEFMKKFNECLQSNPKL